MMQANLKIALTALVVSMWLSGIQAKSFGCITQIDCTQASSCTACNCPCFV